MALLTLVPAAFGTCTKMQFAFDQLKYLRQILILYLVAFTISLFTKQPFILFNCNSPAKYFCALGKVKLIGFIKRLLDCNCQPLNITGWNKHAVLPVI